VLTDPDTVSPLCVITHVISSAPCESDPVPLQLPDKGPLDVEDTDIGAAGDALQVEHKMAGRIPARNAQALLMTTTLLPCPLPPHPPQSPPQVAVDVGQESTGARAPQALDGVRGPLRK